MNPLYTTEAWQKGVESVSTGSFQVLECILEALRKEKGCLIGRHGTIELTTVLSVGKEEMRFAHILERNAGIFPATTESVGRWILEYRGAATEADIMAAGWYKPLALSELKYLDSVAPSAKRIPLRSIEPYYVENSWIRALEGQRVVVVSSFTETMKKQVDVLDKVWSSKADWGFLRSVDLSFVRSYYSPRLANGICEWPSGISSWEDAVGYLEAKVVESGAKIALLGCGGLAMPLALRLKAKGIVAIVMGGAIQVLFGIRGRRWESHPVISGFYNETWTSPAVSEIPGRAEEIEGACYW
jgi:hypothetical protein